MEAKSYLKVILGSMFSGKTTELINEYNKYKSGGFECCFINHSLRYDVLFINEAQFFTDLYKAVEWLLFHNKKVYVCGLDGDFQRQKFGSILDIIPLCDDVVKLKAICTNCKSSNGIFTKRLSKEKKQTIIGSDNYASLCRKCYRGCKL